MNVLAVVGAVLVVSGVAGIRMAPRMIDAQAERGVGAAASAGVSRDDRIRVMKGSGVVITLVGFGLILLSVS
ncbi:hypothetical protein [Natronosalvus caseinilyticus]|uniref:hypothetical protein n=1 Tax=Natronosalvus caseinilyticus TaxID=2953747 RepID=UPI0028AD63B9|nr:hypothetical protein [Natronosalvus caseinilyticus]